MPNIFKDEYELAIEKGCYFERDCYSKLLDWKNRKARNLYWPDGKLMLSGFLCWDNNTYLSYRINTGKTCFFVTLFAVNYL